MASQTCPVNSVKLRPNLAENPMNGVFIKRSLLCLHRLWGSDSVRLISVRINEN